MSHYRQYLAKMQTSRNNSLYELFKLGRPGFLDHNKSEPVQISTADKNLLSLTGLDINQDKKFRITKNKNPMMVLLKQLCYKVTFISLFW